MDTGTPTIVQKPTSRILPPLLTVSQERGAEQRPQACPNIMSYLKSPTTLSLPSTSMAVAISSKPISTAPQVYEPQSQAHADALATLGIKVRDFAYESTLPPVQAFHRRQILPGVSRPLKRVTRDGEDEAESSSSKDGEGQASSSTKKAKLEREITEPDIQQSSTTNPPLRERGFMNLNDYEQESQSPSQSSNATSQPRELQISQMPLEVVESRYITTPLMTPNGSIQRTDQGNSSMLALQPDGASQCDDQKSFPPRLGLLQRRDRAGLLGPLSPMSSLSSIQSDPPTSPVYASTVATSSKLSHTLKRGSTLRPPPRSSDQSPTRLSPNSSHPSTRYHLRRRPVAISPQSPIKPTTRNHRATTHPASRPLAYSRQSAHSRTKAQPASSSPRARPLRKCIADPSGRDETAGLR
ncbi:hypothetical protein Hypma_012784 [Hypsizygus marmoreus]|uniref:Uncharacterized protein n=1 Tax=Hypsizygus marmoreus TaxID=39966 RepID=A0A369JM04_HYPMA|nr:hypothetical protein Hypma_012784 [Hypsizygus marmoreus]